MNNWADRELEARLKVDSEIWNKEVDIARGKIEIPNFKMPKAEALELCKNYIKGYVYRTPWTVGINEFGINNLRFDALVINYSCRQVRGYEFKSSRQDFLSDKKWVGYHNYCNVFVFICPPEVITKEDLLQAHERLGGIYLGIPDNPIQYIDNTGLIWVMPDGSYKNIKRPKIKELDREKYYDLVTQMISKIRFRKDDLI